jgi:hypothetical protein
MGESCEHRVRREDEDVSVAKAVDGATAWGVEVGAAADIDAMQAEEQRGAKTTRAPTIIPLPAPIAEMTGRPITDRASSPAASAAR